MKRAKNILNTHKQNNNKKYVYSQDVNAEIKNHLQCVNFTQEKCWHVTISKSVSHKLSVSFNNLNDIIINLQIYE